MMTCITCAPYYKMLKDLQIHICVQTFRKIKDLKHMLVIVLFLHLSSSLWCVINFFYNGLTVYQLWLAFPKVPKCLTKKLEHSLQLGNNSCNLLVQVLRYVYVITWELQPAITLLRTGPHRPPAKNAKL